MRSFDFDKTPITDILNDIILDAVSKGASDIHFDPSKKDLVIRLRIDGDLMDYALVPFKNKNNITTRIKVMANMNITETRLPQDGAIKRELNNKLLDLRVSSLPTNAGEKVVIRILDYTKSFQGLETLGFSELALEKVKKLCKIPSGIILVTGATGTGKSTTVYSILQKMNTEEVNIITVEDPVEMDIPRVNQVQVQPEIGLDFASVLRSILRQDPNIIMIGEIRDDETAKIAVRASITGHIVLSTIHTNNSLNTIERLTDMDVERYLLGSALMGIISQRLAKKLCPKCRTLVQTSEYEKNAFRTVLNKEVTQIYKANKNGCPDCINGYKGRIAILEVLTITEEIRDAIVAGVSKEQLRDLVYKGDVISLLEDGLDKVTQGLTSFEEIVKIIDLDDDLATTDSEALKKNLSMSSAASQKEHEEFQKQKQEQKMMNAMNQNNSNFSTPNANFQNPTPSLNQNTNFTQMQTPSLGQNVNVQNQAPINQYSNAIQNRVQTLNQNTSFVQMPVPSLNQYSNMQTQTPNVNQNINTYQTPNLNNTMQSQNSNINNVNAQIPVQHTIPNQTQVPTANQNVSAMNTTARAFNQNTNVNAPTPVINEQINYQ